MEHELLFKLTVFSVPVCASGKQPNRQMMTPNSTAPGLYIKKAVLLGGCKPSDYFLLQIIFFLEILLQFCPT